MDRNWRFSDFWYFEILSKILSGNGIFNNRRCRKFLEKITRNWDFKSSKNGISIFGHLLKIFLFFFVFNTCQVFGTLSRLLKTQNHIMQYAIVNSFLYFIHFNNLITNHLNIWCIARGGWDGFYCFLTNIFQITFKYLQNLVTLHFQLVKSHWEKYNMREADEDAWMLIFS